MLKYFLYANLLILLSISGCDSDRELNEKLRKLDEEYQERQKEIKGRGKGLLENFKSEQENKLREELRKLDQESEERLKKISAQDKVQREKLRVENERRRKQGEQARQKIMEDYEKTIKDIEEKDKETHRKFYEDVSEHEKKREKLEKLTPERKLKLNEFKAKLERKLPDLKKGDDELVWAFIQHAMNFSYASGSPEAQKVQNDLNARAHYLKEILDSTLLSKTTDYNQLKHELENLINKNEKNNKSLIAIEMRINQIKSFVESQLPISDEEFAYLMSSID